jgi:hypothetical protein
MGNKFNKISDEFHFSIYSIHDILLSLIIYIKIQYLSN